MKKLAQLIIKFKWLILAVTAVLIVLSIVGTIALIKEDKINSDMMSYLPEEFDITKGVTFLQQNFGIKSDIMIVVEGREDDDQLRESIKNIKEFDGISQFIWVEDIEYFESLPLDSLGNVEISLDTSELKEFLKYKIDDDSYNYVLIAMVGYNSSTKEAYDLLDNMKSELGDRPMATAGSVHTAQTVMAETLEKLPFYLIFASLGLILILLLTTSSYIEPLILMISLGISVLVNMGSNIFFPSISVISFATSSILQLALTMDYAVFYMHVYKEKRKQMDSLQATKNTIPSIASSIIASAFTTIGGFAALFFMKFELGGDMAMVLMKGVFLSLLTVLIIQPIFVLLFDKILLKTEHKELRLNVKPIARFSLKYRFVIFIMAILLIVPLYLGQSSLKYSYFETYELEINTPQEELAYELGNQLMIAVPLQTKNGKSHKEFIEELQKDPKISGVMSAFTALDISVEDMNMLLNNPFSKPYFTSGYASTFFKEVKQEGQESVWYTLYTAGIKGSAEDSDADRTHQYLNQLTEEYFGETYQLGILVGVNDMRKVTPLDFLVVTIISVCSILVILMFLFRSFRKGILLILVIELGIWINLCISFLLGQKLNFIIYIMISSVQLGCTVDYAILVANKFEQIKWQFTKAKDAAFAATVSAFPAVASSAAIIITACLSMYIISDNLIIKQLTGMLARGAFISAILVLVLQTGVMVYFRRMKTYKEMLTDMKNALNRYNAKLKRKLQARRQIKGK